MENRKIWLIIFVLIGLVAVFVAVYFFDKRQNTWVCENNEWVKKGNPSSLPPTTGCGEPIGQGNEVQMANPASVFCLEKGGQVDIRKDSLGGEYGVCVFEGGKECEEWAFFRGECSVVEEVSEYLTSLSTSISEKLIASPLLLEGEMPGNWYFEANAIVEIYDAKGKLLGQGSAQAEGEWMVTSSVPFKSEITFEDPETATGTLVLKNDNPTGLPEHDKSESYPINFGQKIKIYYSNNIKDPDMLDCTNVYSVVRVIEKTPAIGRMALNELLKGPAEEEKTAGYFTSINEGVKINSLIIDDQVAIVDFDETIEQGVGGSCRVSAIRAQITKTLKQFPSVDEVVILVNGRLDDALQP